MCTQPMLHKVHTNILGFIVLTVLLALPFISANGQINPYKPCTSSVPNAIAVCNGWAVCNLGLIKATIYGQARSYKRCPGWITWNHARVMPRTLFTALGADSWSALQSPNGLPLSFRYTTHPCVGVPDTQQGTINSCPTSPIVDGDPDFTLTAFNNSPTTQLACAAVGMFWSSAEGVCFPQATDPALCESFGGYWNFTTGDCSDTPESVPTNQEDCENANWFWNPLEDYCQQDPPPPCDLEPVTCDSGSWSFLWCTCIPLVSPIVVDVDGDGFDLTSAAEGATFNLNVIGGREKLAWTRSDSDDAWLALDRNGNGFIDNGTELFGDVTAQPDTSEGEKKNGFRALAEYDRLANGGNGDGLIDRHDSIFSSLRLWRDTNHNGMSDFGELHTLSALSVMAFELDYKLSKTTDSNGNQFSFRAKVRSSKDKRLGRWAWDVYLVRSE